MGYVRNLVRKRAIDDLNKVVNGEQKLYNTVSKQYVEVTKENVEKMADMITDLTFGHGTNHLIFKTQ